MANDQRNIPRGSALGELDPIYTRKAAATRLGISLATLGNMERRGAGPARTRISERRVGYTLASLTNFVVGRTA